MKHFIKHNEENDMTIFTGNFCAQDGLTTMTIFAGDYCAQGDLNIFKVDTIDDSLPEVEKSKDGFYIVAHSETGHHHVIDGNTARVFGNDEFESFIEVPKKAEVIHVRSFKTHKPIQLPAGKYRITRQREYTPKGYRRAAD